MALARLLGRVEADPVSVVGAGQYARGLVLGGSEARSRRAVAGRQRSQAILKAHPATWPRSYGNLRYDTSRPVAVARSAARCAAEMPRDPKLIPQRSRAEHRYPRPWQNGQSFRDAQGLADHERPRGANRQRERGGGRRRGEDVHAPPGRSAPIRRRHAAQARTAVSSTLVGIGTSPRRELPDLVAALERCDLGGDVVARQARDAATAGSRRGSSASQPPVAPHANAKRAAGASTERDDVGGRVELAAERRRVWRQRTVPASGRWRGRSKTNAAGANAAATRQVRDAVRRQCAHRHADRGDAARRVRQREHVGERWKARIIEKCFSGRDGMATGPGAAARGPATRRVSPATARRLPAFPQRDGCPADRRRRGSPSRGAKTTPGVLIAPGEDPRRRLGRLALGPTSAGPSLDEHRAPPRAARTGPRADADRHRQRAHDVTAAIGGPGGDVPSFVLAPLRGEGGGQAARRHDPGRRQDRGATRRRRVGWRSYPLSFDQSSLSTRLGAGRIYASVERRHWGPSWVSSLILDGGARPVPAVGWRKESPTAFRSPLLSWLGPWHLDAFAGQTVERNGPQHPHLLGVRIQVMPLRGLELAVSRTLQWGGSGRSESLGSLARGLLGYDNVHSTIPSANESGNGLAGFDARYTHVFGAARTASIYAQAIGEDEAGHSPSHYLGLLGVDTTFAVGAATVRLFVERANTTMHGAFGAPLLGGAYRHHIYLDGYTHQGEPLGHPAGATSGWARSASSSTPASGAGR